MVRKEETDKTITDKDKNVKKILIEKYFLPNKLLINSGNI